MQTHVDDWLDAPTTDESELPAKMWLEKFRAPAHKKDNAWLAAHILRCRFHSRIYVVVGCSRMGDVWLAKGRANPKEIPDSYELRVSIGDCSDWSMQLTSSGFIDVDGPWRVSRNTSVTGVDGPMIVDCCNHPLFITIHKGDHPLNRLSVGAGILERIVSDHNALLPKFRSEFESEDDDDDEQETVPTDAQPPDDSVTDYEKFVADLEQWERIAADTKKTIGFNNHSGLWFWHDRSDTAEEAYHTGYQTRVEALLGAIGPYLNEED